MPRPLTSTCPLTIFHNASSQHQNGLAENVGWNLLGPVRHDLDISNLSKELQRQGKLDARGEPGIYIGTGYYLKQSGYLVWLPRLRKTVVAEHVLFDETWFPARLDKHVPNACTALPGNTTSQSYHSDLSGTEDEPVMVEKEKEDLTLTPIHPPEWMHLPSHGSVPQPVALPILSPTLPNEHITAPLTPLSQALFQNLQLHGSILGPHATPGTSATLTAATPPSAGCEARIFFDEVATEDMEW